MSILKRLSTTLFSRIDTVVGEIENHDALIQAAITERRKKIAAAKVQLGRLQQQQTRVTERIAQLSTNDQLWKQRALRSARDDENQALLCLQRRQSIQAQTQKLKATEQEYRLAVEKMSADIARCDDELRAMKQKHELLRARQTSSEALNIVGDGGESRLDELEVSFDRWEVKIAQGEMNISVYDETDSLEQTYIEEENQVQLRAELAELMDQEQAQ